MENYSDKGLGVPAETAVGPSAASPQPMTASGLSATVPNAKPYSPPSDDTLRWVADDLAEDEGIGDDEPWDKGWFAGCIAGLRHALKDEPVGLSVAIDFYEAMREMRAARGENLFIGKHCATAKKLFAEDVETLAAWNDARMNALERYRKAMARADHLLVKHGELRCVRVESESPENGNPFEDLETETDGEALRTGTPKN